MAVYVRLDPNGTGIEDPEATSRPAINARHVQIRSLKGLHHFANQKVFRHTQEVALLGSIPYIAGNQSGGDSSRHDLKSWLGNIFSKHQSRLNNYAVGYAVTLQRCINSMPLVKTLE